MMVELKRISTALGLLAALSTSALAQGSAPNANQLTADSVAGTLRQPQSRGSSDRDPGSRRRGHVDRRTRKPGAESRSTGSHPVRCWRQRRG